LTKAPTMATQPNSPAATTEEGDPVMEQVKKALQDNGVRLWKPPFAHDETVTPNEKELKKLDQQWKKDRILPAEFWEGEERESLFLKCAKEWQDRALKKLEAKKQAGRNGQRPTCVARLPQCHVPATMDLEIKILGWDGNPEEFRLDPPDFVEKVEKSGTKPLVLNFYGISSQFPVVDLVGYLRETLQASNLRLICRGKNITPPTVGPSENTSVAARKSRPGSPSTLGGIIFNSMAPTTQGDPTTRLLCMVSNSADSSGRISKHADLHSRIAAVKEAAGQIRDLSQLEITDQHGNTVAMTGEDRLAFVRALALHRMGLSCSQAEETIVFLLEAVSEWNNHPSLNEWRHRVDNYGLLQLDIAWAYLQLESLSNLPDSIRRLEEAERVLRKQVHINFVTLALAQAEMGNASEVRLCFFC
jgi:hypothetical protein